MQVYIAEMHIFENDSQDNKVIGVYTTMHKCVEKSMEHAHKVAYDRGYCGKKRPTMNVEVDYETLIHEVTLSLDRKMYGYLDSRLDIFVSCYPMTVED